ncbi:hypothetical protein SO802_025699 [Lithocarpus litseifolius]|uniref:DWD hypersensitive to UV-B 1 N-terminal domain-containing protein n=1 Tax=Lithocarpus litseifolius TaxID=425828 RepID=A0AAW2BXR9_9ROSI
MAKIQSSHHEKCSLVVSLDQLKDADLSPLVDAFMAIDSYDIDAVDILQESHCTLSKENITALMHAINLKLRIIDLLDLSLRKDVLWFVTVIIP